MGHVLLKEFGISAIPEIKQITVSDSGPFALLLCSDGITAELAPHDLSSRVEGASTPKEVCLLSSVLCLLSSVFCFLQCLAWRAVF